MKGEKIFYIIAHLGACLTYFIPEFWYQMNEASTSSVARFYETIIITSLAFAFMVAVKYFLIIKEWMQDD